MPRGKKRRLKLYGLVVSPGLGRGRVCTLGGPPVVERRTIKASEIPQELSRLERALAAVRKELLGLRDRVRDEVGGSEAAIFDAHLLFLEDPYLRSRIIQKLVEEHINVEAALQDVLRDSAGVLESVSDGYLRERAQDIRDVGERVLEHLAGEERERLFCEVEEIVLVGEELTPTQTARLDRRRIRGIVTSRGGPTSHAAILARSLGVPMVTGIRDALQHLTPGSQAIVDGYRGLVIVHPLPRDLALYERRQEEIAIQMAQEEQLRDIEARTRDGRRIHLYANIGSAEELEAALEKGAEGIGLYRTEIHFIDREQLPDEEEQFGYYRRVVEGAAPRPVVIRTLDLGGDKLARFFRLNHEDNPYLGLRAIRVSLAEPELFLAQVRALLRAGAYGNLKILLPMVSTIEEVEETRRLIEQAKQELRAQGVPFPEQVPVGAMVEVPSAAVVIDDLLQLVDFVSVGTNDLIQYTLAVDRSNVRVSQLYEPLSPAVLRLLDRLQNAAARAGKEISICGEMAGDTRYTALLVGMGYQHLSMSPFFIPQVKRVILTLHFEDAHRVVRRILELPKIARIRRELSSYARKLDREGKRHTGEAR